MKVLLTLLGGILIGVSLCFTDNFSPCKRIHPMGDPRYMHYDEDTLTVNGTWTIHATKPGDKIADPINIAEISCDRMENICRENGARISAFDRNLLLSLKRPITYDITSWNYEIIMAEYRWDCYKTTLSINTCTN